MRISDWSSDVCSSDLRGCGCWASIRWRTPMVEPQYRAVFDFEIEFTNGGGLRGHDFRLDIEGDDIGDAELVDHVVSDLRLRMVGTARIINKPTPQETHKRTPPETGPASGKPQNP